MLKVLTVVGARPQFIKAATVSRAVRNHFAQDLREIIVHTGQHYDNNMSQVFFDEMDIPRPDFNLQISGGNHGAMTGRMLEAIECVIIKERPDWVLVYGDTNSTLAAALAAVKLHIPVAHVEAGLRSFNMRMPEEINRIVTDQVSTLLFCPSKEAVHNLTTEGLTKKAFNVGDVMYDAAIFYKYASDIRATILQKLNLTKDFILATCHRAENTDDPRKLSEILIAFEKIATQIPVVFPVHPRTLKKINEHALSKYLGSLNVIEPVSFLNMVALEKSAMAIITDSGGVQKEAFFYGVPCITLRDETEWVETIELGMNTLAGANASSIIQSVDNALSNKTWVRSPLPNPYGDGMSAEKILKVIIESQVKNYIDGAFSS
jgi:UDP-GlcNAc3NAcA epimerase